MKIIMHFCFVLVSLVLVKTVRSEVVDEHFTKCKSFFYKNSPPRGFDQDELSAICQRYQNSYHFATLYNTDKKIPMYSAYRLDALTCPENQPKRRSKWFIEPQLSGLGRQKDMTTEGSLAATYMQHQALNIDYPNTNYDRGHLNPNFYQCDVGRTATFTLTNAVPQDPCFNQQIWKDMEGMSKTTMTTRCNFAGAKRYFVTGAVPSGKRIPSEQDDKEGDEARVYNRVSIPKVMWTAACCDSTNAVHANDRNNGFSFGYYGDNIPDSYVIPYTVADLEIALASKYGIDTLNIFADSCFSNTATSRSVVAEMAVPVERKIAETLLNMAKSSESSLPPAKRKFIKTVSNKLHTNAAVALKNWRFADADFGLLDKRSDIQATRKLLAPSKMTTILTYPISIKDDEEDKSNELYMSPRDTKHDNVHEQKSSQLVVEGQQVNWKDDMIKNTFISNTEVLNKLTDEYAVVPTQESTLSATGTRCRHDHECGYHSYKYKWCYTDWSNNWDYCCESECEFGQGKDYSWCHTSAADASKWAYCSQRSSKITISGKPCRADHECGLHRKFYYWCYTDTNNNWDRCCQPWHNCANYGSFYKWCNVGYKKETSWYKCHY